MDNPNLDNIVLALLFASDEPLSARRIAALVEDVTVADVKRAVDSWNARADGEAWSIGIEQVAGGYRLSTRPEYAAYVSRLYAGRRRFRLSRAGLETLAIIAYKQPITRAEIESIRGVGTGSVIANLMERSLVQIVGKARVLGAPFLYGTTQEFLEYLGLNSLKDLPNLEDLEALLAREAEAESALDDDGAGAESTQRPDAEDIGTAAEEGLAGLVTPAGGEIEIAPTTDDDGDERYFSGSARVGRRVEVPVSRPPAGTRPDSGEDGPETPGADDEPAEDADERRR